MSDAAAKLRRRALILKLAVILVLLGVGFYSEPWLALTAAPMAFSLTINHSRIRGIMVLSPMRLNDNAALCLSGQ